MKYTYSEIDFLFVHRILKLDDNTLRIIEANGVTTDYKYSPDEDINGDLEELKKKYKRTWSQKVEHAI